MKRIKLMKQFPIYRQTDANDCGPTCLRMITKFYGKRYSAHGIRRISGLNGKGLTIPGIVETAEKLGFRTKGVHLTYDNLVNLVKPPCILKWNDNHFVVLLPYSDLTRPEFRIADPAAGIVVYSEEKFKQLWLNTKEENDVPMGSALILDTTPEFYESKEHAARKIGWMTLLRYLKGHRWQAIQVLISLFITLIFQLLFPYLTQSIVDTGIGTRNIQYITIILIAQMMLVFSRAVVDFIRCRLILSISVLINISILSDFWVKISKLPFSYFDKHHAGDTLQRVEDNRNIQNFITGPALNTLFSLLNLVVFSVILFLYNLNVFIVFLAGCILYFLWVYLFLGIRRRLNYKVFNLSVKENNATLQLVHGMREIRLNNAEHLKRRQWEDMQVGLFRLYFKSLTYGQLQQAGVSLIDHGKDVIITFMVANLVIQNKLTLGTMLAVQYIIGQLSGPIEQFVAFIQGAQDAKMSMERIDEVHALKDEEEIAESYINQLPKNRYIQINSLSFAYPGDVEPVLMGINLSIPEGKITAIVGMSGSGKTTLIKILLKFYDNYSGEIKIGESDFRHISHSFWRKQCGAVLQDGYIFDDTIERNIALGQEVVDYPRVIECCRIANVLSFVESLPNGLYTQLGTEGVSISQGQKQRLLIARAIYKDPKYIFFDEATNALDTNNERIIVENLKGIFSGKTVVVIAHRLSTVKSADNIVVFDKGRIAEQGTHEELSCAKGKYWELVRNQLDLEK